jgi:hypothetical protein
MKKLLPTKRTPAKDEPTPSPKSDAIMRAYEALRSMPKDFFADGRDDPPPEDVEGW